MVHAAVVMVTWSVLMLRIDWGDWARSGRTLEMIGFMRGQPQKLQGHGSPCYCTSFAFSSRNHSYSLIPFLLLRA